ncbi:MAG: M48 family metalloprotease [Acidobacteriia bacterium]|nr:M48 family metalloprotease [Terriglobia bacterium]
MRLNFRSLLALLLCELLLMATGCRGPAVRPHGVTPTPPPGSLAAYLQKSYLDLFELSPELHFTAEQIQAERGRMQQSREYCVARYKERASEYGGQLKQTEDELERRTHTLNDKQRHEMHCKIQDLQTLQSQSEMLGGHAIPTAYDNRAAKLELIEKWPAERLRIQQEIASGAYHGRRWANVKDIGFRVIAADQEKDIKAGQEAVEQLKRQGMMPKEVEDKAIVDYVTAVAERVAAHSDLRVPLHVTVLNTKEINAFALPGGYLFIERGLLEAAENESQLAGVIAHELAHVTARHAHKLITRATIASIFYQAAQVAAVILTGGIVGIGLYYALQYGFFGLGLVLNLKLLGVSREYELEADQLGIQYAWSSGYDPRGYIQFFDKIATREGYVNGVSWFRTHPPFYQRMVDSEREILFLPAKEEMIEQTSAFEEMKKSLHKVRAQADKDEKNRPTLFAKEKGCPAPKKLEYTPGQPIESICFDTQAETPGTPATPPPASAPTAPAPPEPPPSASGSPSCQPSP